MLKHFFLQFYFLFCFNHFHFTFFRNCLLFIVTKKNTGLLRRWHHKMESIRTVYMVVLQLPCKKVSRCIRCRGSSPIRESKKHFFFLNRHSTCFLTTSGRVVDIKHVKPPPPQWRRTGRRGKGDREWLSRRRGKIGALSLE